MQTFNFYPKGDRSRKWTVTAISYTAARIEAERVSGIQKSKMIGYRVTEG